MTEDGLESPRRSSSQTSDTSNKSHHTKRRNKLPKTVSSASSILSPKSDPSLTSFPSLPPDPSPHGSSESAPVKPTDLSRTFSQKVRDRRATLKGLTSASPPLTGKNALFDDSPRSLLEIPGALHLASDAHIERLIARSGAVKLVRQFAQDLAQRDSEISALRVKMYEREQALKKMLLALRTPSAEIEERLQILESSEQAIGGLRNSSASDRSQSSGDSTSTLDRMLHEALSEGVGSKESNPVSDSLDPAATIKPPRPENDSHLRAITGEANKSNTASFKDGQDFPRISRTGSRVISASSSIITQEAEAADETTKSRPSSSTLSRRKVLTNVFQPLNQPFGNSYFIGGTKAKPSNPASLPDDSSLDSRQSARSVTSWTMRLFGGNSQSLKDTAESKNSTSRPASFAHSESSARKSSATAIEATVAAQAKDDSSIGSIQVSKSSASVRSIGAVRGPRQAARRAPTVANVVSDNSEQSKPSTHQKDFGPLEMDAILPTESKPPTMTQTRNAYHTEGLLTDRFGFIYDQSQKNNRRRHTLSTAKKGHELSSLESLRNYRHDSDVEDESPLPAVTSEPSSPKSPVNRTTTFGASDELTESRGPKKWQDYLSISNLTRPAELLLHTPSAAPVVPVNTADTKKAAKSPSARSTSISVRAQEVLPGASSPADPDVSLATASNIESTSGQALPTSVRSSGSPSPVNSPSTEPEPVKLLLERLTKLHDSLQAEKEAKWNEFLRKVRAERNSSTATDRSSKVSNAPEADIIDGEMIGISTLGRPSKSIRTKYTQFKSLVIQGIPVSLRPKIWSECSGASARRSPGHYDDLVARSEDGRDLDAEIVGQIQADIGRTLTDNTFFRHGPGISRLKVVLLAYSIHNPSVGYCQGMNLITASLLLIMPTSEDAFWILVAIVENILPSGYFDQGLVVSRADQIVLRDYVAEVLPKLGAHFDDLGVELEACSLMWFLSLFTGCLSAEALYRVWDVVLCLNSSDAQPGASAINTTTNGSIEPLSPSLPSSKPTPASTTPTSPSPLSVPPPPSPLLASDSDHPGSSSPFLFQLCLALLKLNEPQLLTLQSPARVYSYINHNMTNHAISIDGLVSAAEALRKVVRRDDVLARRANAARSITG